MKKSKLIILLFVVAASNTFAQTRSAHPYVVFTFENHQNESPHGKSLYYWIIDSDSISSINSIALYSRLFIRGFSKNDSANCCEGKTFNPFVIYPNTSFDLAESYTNNVSNFEHLIQKNRKKVQVIIKKWNNRSREKTVVFATPISGIVCFSNLDEFGKKRYGYLGLISIPISSFIYDNTFWGKRKSKYLLNRDYSKFNFSIIP